MPEIPEGATVPQDHKKPAAQIEAERATTIPVVWREQAFTIPATIDDCPIEVIEAMEAGKGLAIVRGILGESQYAAFKAKHKPTVRDLNSLSEVIMAALGFEKPGE